MILEKSISIILIIFIKYSLVSAFIISIRSKIERLIINILFQSVKYRFMYDGDITTPNDHRNLSKYLDFSHVNAEQVDDEIAILSGYIECVSDFPKEILKGYLETSILVNNNWIPAPNSYMHPNFCKAITQKHSEWYNITKLWVPLCPPKKGVNILFCLFFVYAYLVVIYGTNFIIIHA